MTKHWFDQFIALMVRKWKAVPKKLPNPSLSERTGTMLPRHVSGDLGERDVAYRLQQYGYRVARSPGSHSPSDVWGLGEYESLTHVSLIQAKATQNNNPEELDSEDITGFFQFANFVKSEFPKAAIVPLSNKVLPLVVSYGYAAVRVEQSPFDYEPHTLTSLIEAYPFDVLEFDASLSKEIVNSFVTELHSFSKYSGSLLW